MHIEASIDSIGDRRRRLTGSRENGQCVCVCVGALCCRPIHCGYQSTTFQYVWAHQPGQNTTYIFVICCKISKVRLQYLINDKEGHEPTPKRTMPPRKDLRLREIGV